SCIFSYIYAMPSGNEIQVALFQALKHKLPENFSFVHEIAELLEISYDSAYRRIRGDKPLTLNELVLLNQKFGLSVDTFLNVETKNVVFNCHAVEAKEFRIKQWLETILADLKKIQQAREKEIIYAAKDPPLFHYFHYPEIGAFKMFFYQKTLLNFPEFEDKKLRLDEADEEIYEVGKRMLIASNSIPTIEIWNEDTFYITLRQIEYYWIAGYFASKDDVLNLCDKLQKWLSHIQKQAELGFKFLHDQDPVGVEGSFKMYENEVVLNDNSILVKMPDVSFAYLTFNVLSLLVTSNPVFTGHLEQYFRGLIKQSNLISSTGAKERNRFFNKLNDTVEKFRETIV
ncbi:MAG TPA: helix-turn-helix domain-containing protein, partial [Bacteroidales bacterium]|nr:helix-turn-helix domain-containing protein [Bacteroidales bacterium]